jgi:D-xylose reductase
LQVELHPQLTQEKLIRYCQQEQIAVTAFSPLGAQSYFSLGMANPEESVLSQTVVQEIASHHERTPAQVVLRWGVQRGTAIIPKTSKVERLEENLKIFDFELSDAEMDSISALNQNRRYNDPGVFAAAAFNTFLPIYE